jgi:hypothetical protein
MLKCVGQQFDASNTADALDVCSICTHHTIAPVVTNLVYAALGETLVANRVKSGLALQLAHRRVHVSSCHGSSIQHYLQMNDVV